MQKQGQKFTSVEIKGQTLSRDKEPNECPVCHSKIVPDELTWAITGYQKTDNPQLECVFKCPNKDCGHLFIASYQISNKEIYGRSGELAKGLKLKIFKLAKISPRKPLRDAKAAEIADLSSDFLELFSQAAEAEAQRLFLMAGSGYCNALECLVKDYYISQFPEKEDEISGKNMYDCFKETIKDKQILQYLEQNEIVVENDSMIRKKWPEYEIKNLKILIRLIENWIVNSILTRK